MGVDHHESTACMHYDMWHMTWDTWYVTHDMWHMTCDTWHVTHDTWHVTCNTRGGGVNILSKCQLPCSDTWHVTHDTWQVSHNTQKVVNIVSKFQLPSSYGLGVKVFWRYFHKRSLTHWLTDSVYHEGVFRTAPDLLKCHDEQRQDLDNVIAYNVCQ